ncbi:peptidoglycan-binding protein, partial [Streptomyces mirabilis]
VTGVTASRQPWHTETQTTPDQPQTTIAVRRTSLSSGLELAGRLGRGTATDVVGDAQGTITRLPQPNDRITAGEQLYEVNAVPVIMFTGARPFWRELAQGMSDGPDVEQLERNLTGLGYADATNLTVDEKFTAATAAAVKRWQKALGLPETGKVELGRVVAVPGATVLVQQVTAKLGSTAGPGTAVLTVTRPDLYATAEVTDDQITQLTPGSRVTVNLAGGTTRGTLVGVADSSAVTGTDGDGSGGDANGAGPTKVTATVMLTDQKKAAAAFRRAQLGVTVTVPGKSTGKVLVVPVTALLALAEGGYGVQVVSGASPEPGQHSPAQPELVPVRIGLIVNALVEITGNVHEGDRVVVPS